MAVSEKDYEILIHFYNNGADTELKSFSCKHIQIETNLSIPKIRNTIKLFLKEGYLKEGVRQHREKKYYITEIGKEKVVEIV